MNGPNGYVKIQQATVSLKDVEYDRYAKLLATAQKGIIVCGQIDEDDFSEAVVALAEKLQFPILADPLSQLRAGDHSGKFIIDTYDTFLRNEDAKNDLKPDFIIRFGAMPVSKALTIFLKENHSAEQIVIDGGVGWRDPTMLSTEMVYCHETIFCEEIAKRMDTKVSSDYRQNGRKLNVKTKEMLS